IAFAGPVLDGGGNAIGLEGGDLGQRVALDLVDIAAKGAGADNGAAPGNVEVDDRGKTPVEADSRRFTRHQGGDGSGGFQIIHSGQTERIGHAGAQWQAHAAALEIGTDQQRHGAEFSQFAGQGDFGGQVGGVDAGNATGLETADLFSGLLGGAARQQHKQLGQLVAWTEAVPGGVDPGHGVVIEMERGGCEIDGRHGACSLKSSYVARGLADVPLRGNSHAAQAVVSANENTAGSPQRCNFCRTACNQAAWPSSHLVRPALGVPAPTFMSAASPPLNRIMVGMERTPYLLAVPGFSSTLSLTILTLPASSVESSPSTGAIARHGPHHSAQQPPRTVWWELRTSSPKLASETCVVMGFCLLF